MSTARRPLGTGPMSTRTTAEEERLLRLLPVELADVVDEELDEDQEHGEAVPAEPPTGPRRRKLGGRGQETSAS
ncbi:MULTISPECIES: hypothetical protein [unclassified Streptomyces]|uniref:hypothetical protein n=1 Tax=unclassified Streptomyces TaxID=2593676 RepID=UPI002E23576C